MGSNRIDKFLRGAELKKYKKKKAPDELIISIIRTIFRKRKIVRSQRELIEIVKKELSEKNPDYGIGAKRLRKIIASLEFVKIETKSRRGKIKNNNCPVCGNKLKEIYLVNLKGEKIVAGYVCKKCGYKSKTKNEIPKRYSFYSIQ